MSDWRMPADEAERVGMNMAVWAHEMSRKHKDSQLAKDCKTASNTIMELRNKLALAEQEKREQEALATAWAGRAAELGDEVKKLRAAV